MAQVSLFRPFSAKYPERENRLTWAFLAALKYNPVLQHFLRELVASRLPVAIGEHAHPWDTARVSTQSTGFVSSTTRLVSLLFTDRVDRMDEIAVEWSDQKRVYDGVIEYPDGLTLIVENKLSHGDVWEEQLSPWRRSYSGNLEPDPLHKSAICLEWADILEGILKYADSGTAAFGGREICRDLLSFVEEFHPELTPYRTFRLCGTRDQALERRTIRLLDELARQLELESREDDYLFRPGEIAERISFWMGPGPERTLNVGLWPADTVGQARQFFGQVDRSAFLGMDKWRVSPNFHFSFVSSYVIRAKTNWNAERYFDYFTNEARYGQMDQERLLPLAESWEQDGLITQRGQSDIEYQFNETNRTTLNVVPGFSVIREWRLDDVIELEERGELEAHLIDALAAPLESWGETLGLA